DRNRFHLSTVEGTIPAPRYGLIVEKKKSSSCSCHLFVKKRRCA
ncbi:unnamed protein product, partial [Tenebrio molitor]